MRDGCLYPMCRGVAWGGLEADILSLIQVDAKTAVGQPLCHGTEGSRCAVSGNLMGGAGSEDGAIVDIG